MSILKIGVDLAKTSFSIYAIDQHGKTVIQRTVKRSKLLELLVNVQPSIVAMEACSGAHYWAREFRKLGHDVRIIPSKYVSPLRTGAKNDLNDARAICEAIDRPSVPFVPIKSEDQQAILAIHRMRHAWVTERTALINQVRAMLTEFGIVLPQGRYTIQRELPLILEDAENGVPDILRAVLQECYEHLMVLNQRIGDSDDCFAILLKNSPSCQRLSSVPGVGAQTATAIVASVGKGQQFDNARHFAAWLGLVPRQYSTGGKPRLGRITKRGDKYLRMLLVHGARAVLANVKDKTDRLSLWCKALVERRGYRRAIVALAAKNARIIWAILQSEEEYKTFAASE